MFALKCQLFTVDFANLIEQLGDIYHRVSRSNRIKKESQCKTGSLYWTSFRHLSDEFGNYIAAVNIFLTCTGLISISGQDIDESLDIQEVNLIITVTIGFRLRPT